MLLFDTLKLTLTMSRISSSAAVALIGFQIFLQILFVDSHSLNATSEISLNDTLYDDDEDSFFITGGQPVLIREFPFMAALGWINDSGDLKFHGGGMVISPTMVLTAAHCAYKDGKLPDIVYIGGNSLSQEEEYDTGVIFKYSVVNVTIFPDYDPNQGYYDIAILQLNDTTSWSQRVCLWRSENLTSNDVTAIGYGLTEFAGMGSQQLMKVNLTTFPSDFCAPFFKRQRKFKLGLSDSHICAGDKNGVKDTCQGDSGGPLIVKHNYEMFAVGITSSGQACSGFPPAIYTKIYPYIDWIASVLMDQGESLQECASQETDSF